MDEGGFREVADGRRLLWRAFLGAGLLGIMLIALRFGVIENDLLPRDCNTVGSSLSCGLTWLLTQSFHAQRLGIFALVFGALGFLAGLRSCGWIGWFAGVAGLVLYSSDYASVGMLLGLFTLLRTYAPAPVRENGQSRVDSK